MKIVWQFHGNFMTTITVRQLLVRAIFLKYYCNRIAILLNHATHGNKLQNTRTSQKIASSRNTKTVSPTWHNVPKANGGHGDEAEVESIKEGPVLPQGEEESTKAQEDKEEKKSSYSRGEIATKSCIIIIFIIVAECVFIKISFAFGS